MLGLLDLILNMFGVWMGYDDNTPLEGVTGGGLPAELCSNIIKKLN